MTGRRNSDQATWAYKDALPCGKIGYIRERIPEVTPQPYDGESYEDTVPDTFDIAERAELAINVLTCATNANQDHQQYFGLYLREYGEEFTGRIFMQHGFSDWCTPKYMEALPLLRLITGSTYNERVDRVWMQVMLKSIGPDGLYYFPTEGKPFYRHGPQWGHGVAKADGSIAENLMDPSITQWTHPQPCGRVINTLLVYYLRDGNPVWKQTIERMIDRLLELAIHESDYCYFPPLAYAPNARYDPGHPTAAKLTGLIAGEINGRCMEGPAKFYKLTGYEPARELASKLTQFIRHHADYYGPNGEFLGDRHFHAHTIYLLNMLEYALAVGDVELVNFVRQSYEWAKSEEAGSCSLIGWFPEFARPGFLSCESGCCIGDMIALALKLSSGGAYDFYEDAERWTRNHFAESQLIDTEWMSRLSATHLAAQPMPNNPNPVPREYSEIDENVPERNVGGFASWSSANDWWVDGGGIMHCCTGNAVRSIYYIWEDSLGYSEGALRVNMLLNRASPWADVYSYVPYKGQVDIQVKQDLSRLLVHAPEWIETGSQEIVASVSGAPRQARWSGRYLDLGAVRGGERATVNFPIAERTTHETIGRSNYRLAMKGTTVVSIEPPGQNCALYQRDHYRDDQVPWRKVRRFLSDEVLEY